MARWSGWRRVGSPGHFRYFDSRGKRITDAAKLVRIQALAIPPAWTDVTISPSATAKIQATGIDRAGRRQYRYHPDFRAAQDEAKFARLVRFAERLPDLRLAMGEHMTLEPYDRLRVSAVAVRLINLTWFRVGSEEYAEGARTYGVTTLTKSHVRLRGKTVTFSFKGKHRVQVRTALVDPELVTAIRDLLALTGGRRLFRYVDESGEIRTLTRARLNDYVHEYLGPEFSAKDFRTWGGTLTAAIALAERGPAQSPSEAKRVVAAVMRSVGEKLGNTPAVARSSYVSPAVIDQYLDGRTVEDFRPRHLRIVRARDIGLDREEQALLSLLRSYRILRARAAA
jgi:DNA topoisomerase-1